ncbi:L-alanine-DL-glutamate epimerase-like enolase superfamily enzyme [Thermocatellispora tengchongensis]|uniref:L-alanine-DL-glutamate epimerase-like enolase superfamily enzyme n=1 Tax=Thermocatellispora tengchongensis TaxID=1073253 RepID=A0A840PKU3_9ACTN|nr:mandelate racemase/muconate lactonizing enzyme family protein [Thermocatellispora tengchongensis]MBB5138411.1 L-alanine-DL-glutamate epimerase-like enolase superfamily enzyme [Thermocatellispora tengchongensis]
MTDQGSEITRVDGRRVALPTGLKDIRLPNGQRVPANLNVLLVRLTDEDGATGCSMLWAQQERQLSLFECGLRYLAPYVRGKRPQEGAARQSFLRRQLGFVGSEGIAAFAVSGLEMAAEDLRCRRQGISLATAFGKTSDRIRAYQTGLMLETPEDDLVAEAKAIYASGVKAVKMIVGKPDLAEDVERVRLVKEALPPDATLMADALQRWDYRTALRAAERFAEFEPAWLEDPLDHRDVAGYRRLAARSPVPIATGESLYRADDFRALVDAGVPYLVGELERVGGFRQWMRLADLAASGSSVFLPHIYPHVSAQLAAALDQREVWWEYVPWFDGLVRQKFDVRDGYLTVSDLPGSGFDPDPEAIERFSRTEWTDLAASG